jgi:predicted lipid-binding transport protein (Tim44 family)
MSQPSPAQPASAVSPQRPGMFGGLMGGLAGFALGGLLGSLLFGGLGHGFGGIGLMDLLLIGGGIVLLMMFLRRRREVAAPAYATAGGPASAYGTPWGAPTPQGGGTATVEMPAGPSELERGIAHIRQMDPGFDPAAVTEFARSTFHEVQAAVKSRDMSRAQRWLTPQMYTELKSQCDQLKAARQTNHIEQIQIRRTELTEAWQEGGRDYVTVFITASLLDYTADDTTGAVIEGSKSAPQNIEEAWTFARPVGDNSWQLSSIQSA